MPTSAPIHTQIVITTNPIFSIIMRRACHGCQTKTKQKEKGSAQKYPQTEVNFFVEPKPQEAAAWRTAASVVAAGQPCHGQLPTRSPFPGSRDFATRQETSPDWSHGLHLAEERPKKGQGRSRFIPSRDELQLVEELVAP